MRRNRVDLMLRDRRKKTTNRVKLKVLIQFKLFLTLAFGGSLYEVLRGNNIIQTMFC